MAEKDEMLEIILNQEIYTKIENYLITEIIPTLSKREIILLLIIIRYTQGYHRKEIITSPKQLAESTKIASHNLLDTIKKLEEKEIIRTEKLNKNQIKIIFDRREIKKKFLTETKNQNS